MQRAVTAADKEPADFKEAKLHKYKSDVKHVWHGRVKYISHADKYDNPSMKCGRMGCFYSWRHLASDSQMGWLKLIFGPGKATERAPLHL